MKINKKQKSLLIILGVILSIFLLVGMNHKTFAVSTNPNLCSYGGTVLSAPSSVQITDSADLNKKVIRLTYSTLPNAECLNIQLSPSLIEQKLQESGVANFDAQNSVMGDIELTKTQKVYNIQERSSEKFRKFNIIFGNRNIVGACTDEKCRADFDSTYGSSNFISSPPSSQNGQCYCAYNSNDVGINGEFSSSTEYDWETTIKIGDQTPLVLYKRPGGQTKLSGTIGSVAVVKWDGNGLSNNNLEAITGRQAYKPYSDNQWRMTDNVWQYLTQQQNTYRQALIDCDTGTLGGDCTTALENAYGFNAEFETKTSNQLTTWANQENMVHSASIANNQLTVNLNTPIVYPAFTLDIDASAVGIFMSSGQPDVSCPTNIPNLISGQTQDVNILLKNVGSGTGSFTYSLVCNKGSQVVSPSPPQNVLPSSTITLKAKLGFTVASGTDTSSCTFTATDTNSQYGTPKSDSCTFSYSATHQSNCIVGTKSCENGNTQVWTCKSDGTYDKETCSYGCLNNACNSQNNGGNTNQTNASGLQCSWYQTKYTEQTKDYGTLYWRYLFNNPVINTTETCATNPLVYVFAIIAVIIILIVGLMYLGKTGANINGIILMIAAGAIFFFRPKASTCSWYNLICMGANTMLSIAFIGIAFILLVIGVILLIKGGKKRK